MVESDFGRSLAEAETVEASKSQDGLASLQAYLKVSFLEDPKQKKMVVFLVCPSNRKQRYPQTGHTYSEVSLSVYCGHFVD